MDSITEGFDYSILGESYSLPRIDSDCHTKENILLNATLLFAKKGYSAVSMRDIAGSIGIQPASLYNHYASKEVLWREVLRHAKELYLLYFDHLENALDNAKSTGEMISTILHEPKRMANVFTCYAFSMIQVEQFRDDYAGQIFTDTLLKYSIDVIKKWLDRGIARGLGPAFDTHIVATILMSCTLIGINVQVQDYLNRPIPFDPAAMFVDLEKFVVSAVEKKPQATPADC